MQLASQSYAYGVKPTNTIASCVTQDSRWLGGAAVAVKFTRFLNILILPSHLRTLNEMTTTTFEELGLKLNNVGVCLLFVRRYM